MKGVRGTYGKGFDSEYAAQAWARRKRRELQSPISIVYTDGSYLQREGCGGGVGVYWEDDSPLNRSFRLDDKVVQATNNRAELMAIHTALELWRDNKDEIGGVLLLRTDSEYSLNVLMHFYPEWRIVGEDATKDKANLDLIVPLYELYTSLKTTVRLEHVKGHAGEFGNEKADKLAGEGALKPLE